MRKVRGRGEERKEVYVRAAERSGEERGGAVHSAYFIVMI